MSKPALHIVSPSHFEKWDYRNPDTVGIGGSETSAIQMSIRLAARDYNVTNYVPLPPDCPDREHAGVHWRDLSEADYTAPGIWILYRCPEIADKFPLPGTRRDQQLWLVCQDEDYPSAWWHSYPGNTESQVYGRQDKLHRVVALCEAQAASYRRKYARMAGKVCVSSNGLRRELVESVLDEPQDEPRNPYRMLYPSSPDRALVPLLEIFARVRERVPQAELWVAYGFDNIEKIVARVLGTPEAERCPGDVRYLKWVTWLKGELQKPGVRHFGRMPQRELYRLWRQCGLWVYANRFRETSCQPAGSLVFTRNGMVPIEDVKVGSEVLTHMGRFRKVTELKRRVYDGIMYTIRRKKDSHGIRLTAEHPLLVATMHKRADAVTVRQVSNKELYKQRWLMAEEIRPEIHYLITPKMPFGGKTSIKLSDYVDLPVRDGMVGHVRVNPLWKEVADTIELTNDFLYLLGVFAAEGYSGEINCEGPDGEQHTKHSGVTTSHHAKERGIAEKFAAYFGGKVHDISENELRTVTYNTIWSRFFAAIIGKKRDKHIPPFIWDVSEEGQLAFLQGAFDGDGHTTAKGSKQYTTISPSLAYGIAQILTNVGRHPSITYSEHRDAYQVSWQADMRQCHHVEREDCAATWVRSVETEHFRGVVYNFEVEEDHSYVTDRTVVHNCITSMEAQSLGAIPVICPIWAVGENVQHGVTIREHEPTDDVDGMGTARPLGGYIDDPLTLARFADETVRLMREPWRQEMARPAMMRWAAEQFDYERFVGQWVEWIEGREGVL